MGRADRQSSCLLQTQEKHPPEFQGLVLPRHPEVLMGVGRTKKRGLRKAEERTPLQI